MRNRVAVQRGHLIDYGAPIEQAVRLAGAGVAAVGRDSGARVEELSVALDGTIAAALYVVSHHCLPYDAVPLCDFISTCKARDVPVIVDVASEYDLRGFISAGADLAVYSAHKFLGGLTGGIVAGRKDLVRAAYLQNWGIGRGMKVGKEGIAGAMAALEAWKRRDHAAARLAEEQRIARWLDRLGELRGIRLEPSPDPTGNPITRLRVHVEAKSQMTAWQLADALASGASPIIVRDDDVCHGYFELDPCNLGDAEAEEVAGRLRLEIERAGKGRSPSFAEWDTARLRAQLAWPDKTDD
jgi:L-seryl-tRNA(Ser) seleniumtransferase